MEHMIKIQKVCKAFNKKNILSDINLEIAKNKVTGIVGINGSGKTTLLKIILGLLPADSGSVYIADYELKLGYLADLPIKTGILLESPLFLRSYSGFYNLRFLTDINEKTKISSDKIKQTLSEVGLDPKSKKALSKYSLGMKQRLGIAQAIIEDPDILVLDEPTNALDKDGLEMFEKIIKRFIDAGSTIILVSHSNVEINKYCDFVYKIADTKISNETDSKKSRYQITLQEAAHLQKLTKIGSSIQIDEDESGSIVINGFWNSEELNSVIQDLNYSKTAVKKI